MHVDQTPKVHKINELLKASEVVTPHTAGAQTTLTEHSGAKTLYTS